MKCFAMIMTILMLTSCVKNENINIDISQKTNNTQKEINISKKVLKKEVKDITYTEIKNKYHHIYDFHNNMAMVSIKKDDNGFSEFRCGYINIKGEEVISPKYLYASEFYKENYAIVRDEKGYSIIDSRGNQIIDTQYTMLNNYEGNLIACKKNKYGVISKENKVIIPFEFDSIQLLFNNNKLCKDLLVVIKDEKYGIYNVDGKQIIEPKFSFLRLEGDRIIVFDSIETAMYNKEGKEIVPLGKYSNIVYDNLSNSFVVYKNGNINSSMQKGYIDRDGKEIVPLQTGICFPPTEGMMVISEVNDYEVKYKIKNLETNEILPNYYDSVGYFLNEYSIVYKNINNISKCGLVNKYGKMIIPFKYRTIIRVEGTPYYEVYDEKNNRFIVNYEDKKMFEGVDRILPSCDKFIIGSTKENHIYLYTWEGKKILDKECEHKNEYCVVNKIKGSDRYLVSFGNDFFIIDSLGNIIFYDKDINIFKNNINYYNTYEDIDSNILLAFEKDTKKYIYIDANGKRIIDDKFDYATIVVNDISIIEKDDVKYILRILR